MYVKILGRENIDGERILYTADQVGYDFLEEVFENRWIGLWKDKSLREKFSDHMLDILIGVPIELADFKVVGNYASNHKVVHVSGSESDCFLDSLPIGWDISGEPSNMNLLIPNSDCLLEEEKVAEKIQEVKEPKSFYEILLAESLAKSKEEDRNRVSGLTWL